MGVKKIFILILLFVIQLNGLMAQQGRVVFYNVENLFDTQDDTLTNDNEFLPDGAKHWTYGRMYRKIVRIYQTLVALGEGDMPAVIGLCEIENREVLKRLVYNTPLSRLGYRIIHRESPDARGIDVAMLYRPDIFEPDSTEWLYVDLPGNQTTREILMVRGKLWQSVTTYFYINHWPSRYGGAGGSKPKRLAAASVLAVSIKQVCLTDDAANIIIMGDFNDDPGDESLQAIGKILKNDPGNSCFLTNLSVKTSITDIEGTIKYQGSWSVFDQVIVSRPLITGSNGCYVISGKAEVFKANFLLEPDVTYTGFAPFRTYKGPAYHNGFSDHLPVSILIGIVNIEN